MSRLHVCLRSLLVLVSPLAFVAVALTCIPDGECRDVEQDRPNLPATPPGAPEPPAWTEGDGSPTAVEDDPFVDDTMGDATPTSSGNAASVRVCNDGGDLVGPNGEVQNGGAEGDCIEVAICWTYTIWVKVPELIMTDTGFAIGYRWIKTVRQRCNGPETVCPCP